MFQIKNVTKKYNNEFALNDVTLTIGKGMNFIVGASGSGKTTLLKLISGMEQDFDGDILYCDKEIRKLSDDEKSFFYNSVFGFVWQDFNLLEGMTVLENVLLPANLNGRKDIVNAEKILNKLNILEFEHMKVKNLSGGQKQRVAIARELMKDPEVIIADEPTSALDEATAKDTIAILREISKKKTVIVVTHDTSIITKNDTVFELDKGELVKMADCWKGKTPIFKKEIINKLTPKSAFSSAFLGIKRNGSRFAVSALSLFLCAAMLLVSFCGILGGGQAAFDKLFSTYGDGLLDISVAGSFIGAGGIGGGGSDKPNTDVDQDISGLYEKYAADSRVDFVLFQQSFDTITVTIDGSRHTVKKSNNVPVLSKLISGKMPGKNGREVVVPENFVKNVGHTNRSIIGKEIEFDSAIFNWSTGSPVPNNVKTTAKVVGVGENIVNYTDGNGDVKNFSVDDSFFFNKVALSDMRSQASLGDDKINFLMRAKNPKEMISLKNELNKTGIVPLGRFELVEDIVNLSAQTGSQSLIATIALASIAIVLLVAVYVLTAVMRRREYAIYKICGYSKNHLRSINLLETILLFLITTVLVLAVSPLIDLATKSLYGVGIMNVGALFGAVAIALIISIISHIICSVTSAKIDLNTSLKTGGKK